MSPEGTPEQLLQMGHPLAAAQAFEHAGRGDEAAFAYAAAGDWPNCGRILVQRRRMHEAGFAYLRCLPEQPTPGSYLPEAARHHARQAASCLERAGQLELAAPLFGAVGEHQRAAELLRRSGRRLEANRVARGRPVQGGPWPAGFVSSAPAVGFMPAAPASLSASSPSRRPAPAGPPSAPPRSAPPARSAPSAPPTPVAAGTWRPSPPSPARSGLLPALGPAEADPAERAAPSTEPSPDEGVWRPGQPARRPPVDNPGFDSHVGLQPAGDRPTPSLASTGADLAGSGFDFDAYAQDQPEADLLPPGLGEPMTDTHDLPLPEALAPVAGAGAARNRKRGRARPEPPPNLDELVRSRTSEMGLGELGPGSVIADRYEILSPLGEGGFAVVFKVQDRSLEEQVALKLFKPGSSDKSALARFKREVRIARQLAHRNVVRTWEFGTWRQAHFITMEMMAGLDLHQYNDDVHWGAMPPPIALGLVSQGLDGLGAAHELGIVHRDIKLRNLFVLEGPGFDPPEPLPPDPRACPVPRLKVMDFGIAAGGDFDQSLTRTGMVVGTPTFVAPERLRVDAGDPTPQVDIYAMGIVLYRLLTGKLPYSSKNIAELFKQILTKQATPPSVVDETIPESLDDVVFALMDRDPDKRPATAVEARALLDDALGRLPRG